jgi:hypothetical protein
VTYGPVFHSFCNPVDKGVNPLKPGHTEDHSLRANRGNEECIPPGDTSNAIRQNSIRATRQCSFAVSQGNPWADARSDRDVQRSNNRIVNEINRRTTIDKGLENT